MIKKILGATKKAARTAEEISGETTSEHLRCTLRYKSLIFIGCFINVS